jgi:hypothetical protein
MRNLAKILLVILIITLSCLAIAPHCNKQKEVKSDTEKELTLKLERQTAIAENALVKVHEKEKRIDTLEKRLQLFETSRTKMVSVWNNEVKKAKEAPDTSAINRLDSLHNVAENNCDSAINNLQAQVTEYKGISLEKDTALTAKDFTIAIQNEVIVDQNETISQDKKQLKKEKRKVLVAKIVTGVALVLMVLATV